MSFRLKSQFLKTERTLSEDQLPRLSSFSEASEQSPRDQESCQGTQPLCFLGRSQEACRLFSIRKEVGVGVYSVRLGVSRTLENSLLLFFYY